jgi:trk system potassium uptake protein TrkH
LSLGRAKALQYAVRPRVLLRYLGEIVLVLTALTAVPLIVALAFADAGAAIRYAVVTAALAAGGGALTRIAAPRDVQANEGMVLVALAFLLSPLAMTWPFMADGLGFADALFETVSGVTTTGLSTVPTLANAAPAFLFARAWTQWYGGLGIVVLSLALVIQPGLVAKGLSAGESGSDDLIGGARARARWTLVVYGTLTLAFIAGGFASGLAPFDAVLHALAGVSTGGFAPRNASVAPLGGPAQAVVLLGCVAGALPLTFLYGLVRRRRLGLDAVQAATFLVLLGLAVVGLGASLRLGAGLPWREVVHHAPILAASAQSTAGFSSISPSELDRGTLLLLTFFMFVGGSVGSTAGGIKVLRLLVTGAVLRTLLARAGLVRDAVLEPRVTGRRLGPEEIQATLVLIGLFAFFVAASWAPFVYMGYDPVRSFFEVVSAIATVGLSAGVTSHRLPGLLKGVLAIDMLLGRLEIVAWLVALSPGTWWGRRKKVA